MAKTLSDILNRHKLSAEDLWDDSQSVRVFRPVMLPVGSIVANPWNPQEMSDEEFNLLSENVMQSGMMTSLQVMPISSMPDEFQVQHPEKNWVLIGGESRTDVMQVMAPDAEIPCAVLLEIDLDRAKMQTVALNALHGKLNPAKMAALWQEMAQKYSKELVQQWMGFAKIEELRKLVRGLRKRLPAELLEGIDLEAAAEGVTDPSDLAAVIKTLFSRFGTSLKHNFLVLSFGGRAHYLVQMQRPLRLLMKQIFDYCLDNGLDINDVMNDLLPPVIQDLLAQEQNDG